MKKTLLFSLLMAGAVSVFGQGFLDWGNNFTGVGRFPIYGPNPNNALESLSGQSSLGVPSGATVYAGPLLGGANFTFAVYTGTGTDPSTFTLLVSTTFRTSPTGGLPQGLVNGGTIQVAGVAPGNTVNFQIRAWDNGGTGLTYADRVAQGGGFGSSPVVTSGALGGIGPGGPILNPSTIGWTSFNITGVVVPEPSTFALAGLGAAALLIFRRRK